MQKKPQTHFMVYVHIKSQRCEKYASDNYIGFQIYMNNLNGLYVFKCNNF